MDKIKLRFKLINYFLIILSGILYSIPFYYSSLYILPFMSLIPLIYALKKRNYFEGFYAGVFFGLVVAAITSYWLYYPLFYFSGLPIILCIVLLILFFILLALFYGFIIYAYLFTKGKKKFSPLLFAVVWTGVEFFRFKILSDFPFNFSAYTQSNFNYFLQLSSVGGIFLIGFLIVLINGYLFKALSKKKLRFVLPVIIIFIGVFIFGVLNSEDYFQDNHESINIGIVQTQLAPEEKWDFYRIEDNIDYLIDYSLEFDEVELIIWPETSLTFDMVRNEYYRDLFFEKMNGIDAFIQAGSIASFSNKDYRRFNSSFLINPSLELINRYDKMRLVPFGEYVPMSELVEKVSGYSMESNFPGEKAVIFSIEDKSWRSLICSEVLYPSLAKKNIENADFIVTVSNEAWYKKGSLQQQMWSAAVYRAVENRRAVAKSGNYAYGGIISPSGRVIEKGYSGENHVITGKVPINRENTLYQKLGDFMGYISFIIMLLALIIKIILYYRYNSNQS